MKGGCLLLKIPRPSVPLHSRGGMQLSVRNVPKIYRHTMYEFHQFSYIYFATSPLVVDCGLFYRVQLPGCDSPRVLHIQVQVDTWLSTVQQCLQLYPIFCQQCQFHCCVNSSHERCAVMVGFSQQALIWKGVLLESTADCAMLWLLTVLLVNWATIVFLLADLGNCLAIAKFRILQLTSN